MELLHPSAFILHPFHDRGATFAYTNFDDRRIHPHSKAKGAFPMADDLNTTRRSDDMTNTTGRTDAVRSTSDPDFDTNRNTTRDNAAKDTNPDAITGAPGSHPVGTGVG